VLRCKVFLAPVIVHDNMFAAILDDGVEPGPPPRARAASQAARKREPPAPSKIAAAQEAAQIARIAGEQAVSTIEAMRRYAAKGKR
jgi:hypothetical protein